jgi:hypothetical protein
VSPELQRIQVLPGKGKLVHVLYFPRQAYGQKVFQMAQIVVNKSFRLDKKRIAEMCHYRFAVQLSHFDPCRIVVLKYLFVRMPVLYLTNPQTS